MLHIQSHIQRSKLAILFTLLTISALLAVEIVVTESSGWPVMVRMAPAGSE